MSGIVFNRAFLAPSISFSSIASRTFLTELFTVDSKWRFRTLLFSFCFALFMADGWMAKILSPFFLVVVFFRDMVIAHFFGAGMAADAFFVAFRIPNLWRRLVGEGSLTISFIPVYTDYLSKRPEEETREGTHIAFTVAGIILLVLTLLGVFFSPLLIRLV